MGRDGGFHTLYSALGGGAHLALMPQSNPDVAHLAEQITQRTHTVIAVSEGYCRAQRSAARFTGSASEWLLQQLRASGKLDEKRRRVVTEPFSRGEHRLPPPCELRVAHAHTSAFRRCARVPAQQYGPGAVASHGGGGDQHGSRGPDPSDAHRASQHSGHGSVFARRN